MLAKLSRLEERLEEVSHLLSAQEATRDMAEYRKLNREHAELAEVVEHFVAWRRARAPAIRNLSILLRSVTFSSCPC
jgi:peptide chain release factor 1